MGVQGRSGYIELGYSSDTRYLDKVKEKIEQHDLLCKLLTHKGYEVIILPIVLGSAGSLFQCLERATKELDILSTQKDKLYSKLHLHSIHTLHKLVQLRRSLERSTEARIKGRLSAECNLSYPQGQAGKPAYPLRRKALFFFLFFFIFILFYFLFNASLRLSMGGSRHHQHLAILSLSRGGLPFVSLRDSVYLGVR